MIILYLAVAGFLLFKLLTFHTALYIFIPLASISLATSLLIQRQVSKAMKLPIKTGVEDMMGKTAEVVSKPKDMNRAQYMVRYRGELWGANSEHILSIGEQVRVVGL